MYAIMNKKEYSMKLVAPKISNYEDKLLTDVLLEDGLCNYRFSENINQEIIIDNINFDSCICD